MGSKILIVEDEFTVALDIESRLRKMGFIPAGIAHSFEEAISQTVTANPDAVIMDIQISGEKTGIDAARVISERFGIPVIYLTGVTDPEILEEAMGTSPMGYILKPFRDEDIKNQLRIAFQQKRAQDELKKQLKEQAAGSIVAGRPSGEILFIRDNKQIHRIALPEIAYLEAMDNYTLLYTVKGEKYILNGFLKDCIGRIAFPGILRIHRSYAVVRAHISSVEDNLVSVGERLLPVSKSYRESFYEALAAI